MILSLFRKDPAVAAGAALYEAAVEQARKPLFYADFGVPDTVEGRFEMITLHVYLLLRKLKGDGAGEKKTAQKLFDAMFENMDHSLREMGVGDLSVGRKIRALAENFYGRVAAYDEGLARDADPAVLTAALSRNVFAAPGAQGAARLADYMRAAAELFEAQPSSRVIGGIAVFPEPQGDKP